MPVLNQGGAKRKGIPGGSAKKKKKPASKPRAAKKRKNKSGIPVRKQADPKPKSSSPVQKRKAESNVEAEPIPMSEDFLAGICIGMYAIVAVNTGAGVILVTDKATSPAGVVSLTGQWCGSRKNLGEISGVVSKLGTFKPGWSVPNKNKKKGKSSGHDTQTVFQTRSEGVPWINDSLFTQSSVVVYDPPILTRAHKLTTAAMQALSDDPKVQWTVSQKP